MFSSPPLQNVLVRFLQALIVQNICRMVLFLFDDPAECAGESERCAILPASSAFLFHRRYPL